MSRGSISLDHRIQSLYVSRSDPVEGSWSWFQKKKSSTSTWVVNFENFDSDTGRALQKSDWLDLVEGTTKKLPLAPSRRRAGPWLPQLFSMAGAGHPKLRHIAHSSPRRRALQAIPGQVARLCNIRLGYLAPECLIKPAIQLVTSLTFISALTFTYDQDFWWAI